MKAKEFIKRVVRGCSNQMSEVHFTDGKSFIEYHEWITPENGYSAAILAFKEVKEAVEELKHYSRTPSRKTEAYDEVISIIDSMIKDVLDEHGIAF